jgi:hypothetical protein
MVDPKVYPDHADSALIGFSADRVTQILRAPEGAKRIFGA